MIILLGRCLGVFGLACRGDTYLDGGWKRPGGPCAHVAESFLVDSFCLKRGIVYITFPLFHCLQAEKDGAGTPIVAGVGSQFCSGSS
jgi:hypothetical protein